MEVNFTDDLYPEQPRAKDKIILKNFQINAVEMTKAMHRQYYGKKYARLFALIAFVSRCMCLLFNKPFNNNSEITDWEVVSVAQVKGPANQVSYQLAQLEVKFRRRKRAGAAAKPPRTCPVTTRRKTRRRSPFQREKTMVFR